jgi:hypothetical protein
MTKKYFSRKTNALTADKPENLQAPLFEELSDSETSKIVGSGQSRLGLVNIDIQSWGVSPILATRVTTRRHPITELPHVIGYLPL